MSGNRRKVTNPFLEGSVDVANNDKPRSAIQGLFTHLPNWTISFLDIIKQFFGNTISKKQAIKKTNNNEALQTELPDPADLSSRVQQLEGQLQGISQEILKLEAEIDALGGNRHTIVAGNDTLEVGLTFNDLPAVFIEDKKNIAVKNIDVGGNVEAKCSPLPIPDLRTNVVNLPVPGLPGGNYHIKCGNKFSLLAGSQGIDIQTTGPTKIQSQGTTTITGSEVIVGTTVGRTTVEGETVTVQGKSVEMSPTEGQVVVRGTMGCTGNVVTSGHVHAESLSFINAISPARNEHSRSSSPPNWQSGPAFWGSLAIEAIPACLADIQANLLARLSHVHTTKEILSFSYIQDLLKKIERQAYLIQPWEILPTGFILPKTQIIMAGTVPCNYGGVAAGIINATVIAPIPINNFPHTHSFPDLAHFHDVKVPAFDLVNTSEEVRARVSAASQPGPLIVQKGKTETLLAKLYQAAAVLFPKAYKTGQVALRKLSGQ